MTFDHEENCHNDEEQWRLDGIDSDVSCALLSACSSGDIDACQVALIKCQKRYGMPDDLLQMNANDSTLVSTNDLLRHVSDLLGHGFILAAIQNHISLMEFLLSSVYDNLVYRDGICHDPTLFPPFEIPQHELYQCTMSVRYVAYAALVCIDRIALQSVLFLVCLLNDIEAELCFNLAMRKAISAFNASTKTSLSPAAWHPMIIALIQQFPFLEVHLNNFHTCFKMSLSQDLDQLDRIQALQSTLFYELTTSR